MEVHFPADYVDQSEMEVFDGVSTGKYTLGLGQLGMAVPGDREDSDQLTPAGAKQSGLNAVDFAVFHSPYNKLVQKSFARMLFLDSRRQCDAAAEAKFASLAKWKSVALDETLNDRELDLAARGVAKEDFKRMVAPSCSTSQQLGNCYTAAVYVNLATLVDARAKDLAQGARVLLFSYGSGSLASMFELQAREPTASAKGKFSLEKMAEVLDLTNRLGHRNKKTPEEYTARMALRQKSYGAHAGSELTQSIASIAVGDYYLTEIDAMGRRFYACVEEQEPSEHEEQEKRRVSKATQELAGAVYITGTSVGLPGQAKAFEGPQSVEKLLQGENCIQQVGDDAKDAMVALNIVQVQKDKATGNVTRSPVSTREKCIQVSAVVKNVDLEQDYGIAATIAHSMDEPTQLAVAAGLEALRDAGLVDGRDGNWRLADALRDSTGVIYATSFPTMNAAVSETSRFYQEGGEKKSGTAGYEMDRKILFRLLVLANAQLAQLTGARGPNTQTNAACAGATQALGLAQDWIASGKCERVVVVSSDTASSPTMMPLVGGGFRVLGAACLAPTVEAAARPFDAKRSGMIVGSGAIGMVLESPRAFAERPATAIASKKTVRLLATQFSNSAFHGAALEPKHVSAELVRFLRRVESDFAITREELALNGVFYSHETGTNASPTASCAYTEVTALRLAFGPALLPKLLVANTKGFTGHPMSVAFEDVAAVEGLRRGCVPPVVHFESHDPNLGDVPLRLAPGGAYPHKYALRFAAGFGSQLAFSLYTLDD
ncbi:hypothetical protein BBJ28_00001869 [Nothophytophthora sp. Chile5]|nr:hypothetical protein BBJ28_00001869 [Nothophytophthora sp. Chile5]